MSNRLKKLYEHGFTGIEILIVLTILAIIALLVTNNIQESIAKGRDIERQTDIGNIQNALEEYWHTHESYPTDLTSLNINIISLTDPNDNTILITPSTDSSNKPTSSYTVAKPEQEYTYTPYQCSLAAAPEDEEDAPEDEEDEEDAPEATLAESESCQKYVLYSWLEKAGVNEIPYEKTNLHNTN